MICRDSSPYTICLAMSARSPGWNRQLVDLVGRQRCVEGHDAQVSLSARPQRDAVLDQCTPLSGAKLLDHHVQAGLPLVCVVSLNRHVHECSDWCKCAMYRIAQGGVFNSEQ